MTGRRGACARPRLLQDGRDPTKGSAMDMPPIEREETPGGGRYVARLEDGEAEMTWSRGDSIDIIDHTFVPPALRGRSVGEALVARAVADAREGGRRILPLCSFAAAQFRRHPDWADVLAR